MDDTPLIVPLPDLPEIPVLPVATAGTAQRGEEAPADVGVDADAIPALPAAG